jgi:hypothetical protein
MEGKPMKTMTLLAALALVALVIGSTTASALGVAQTPEHGATYNNRATPTPSAKRVADAGPEIPRIWERSHRPDYVLRILPKDR